MEKEERKRIVEKMKRIDFIASVLVNSQMALVTELYSFMVFFFFFVFCGGRRGCQTLIVCQVKYGHVLTLLFTFEDKSVE